MRLNKHYNRHFNRDQAREFLNSLIISFLRSGQANSIGSAKALIAKTEPALLEKAKWTLEAWR